MAKNKNTKIPDNDVFSSDDLFVMSDVNLGSTYICSPCESNNVFRGAIKYCQECQEYLCSDCLKQHNKFRLMRNHVVTGTSGEGNETEPDFQTVQEDRPKCTIHTGKFVTKYCNQHDEICCELCDAFKHRTCPDKINITDAANNVKKSAEYKRQEECFTGMASSLESLKSDICKQLEQLAVDEEQSLSKVENYREELIVTVNKLADESRRRINECYNERKSREQRDMKNVDLAVTSVTETLEGLRSDNNVRAFVCLRSCVFVLEEYKEFLKLASSREPERLDFNIDTSLLTDLSSHQSYFYQEAERCKEAEIRRAHELMLPDHFYMYTRKPPCPGCRGCNDEVPTWKSTPVRVPFSSCNQQYIAEQHIVETVNNEEGGVDKHEDEEDNETGDDIENEVEGEKEKGSETAGEFMFGATDSNLSFASLAAKGVNSRFIRAESSEEFQWQCAGKQLFDGDTVEPVVPLPDLIDAKTGEEDETIEFAQRAKLFRFDKDANQWKEKGIGQMKILKHNEYEKYRLLLRREQVHKLVCNTLLTPEMKLTSLMTSETSWCWIAQDYSEGEAKVEQFAVKFKNADQANSFRGKVDEIQALQKQRFNESGKI